MNVTYKKIESEQFRTASETFCVNLSTFENYLNCFGAFWENNIIGILLLTERGEEEIQILFFHVLPLFRDHSIGSTLLKFAEKHSISTLSRRISAKYNDAENDIERCNRFFYKNNWAVGKYIHTKFCFKKESFKKDYISRFFDIDNVVISNDINFMFFSELSEEKKKQIKIQSEKMLSNGLLPFNNLDLMIKDLSLFGFANQDLIAWSVVDYIKHNEASIRNTFVINRFRNSGLGMYIWYLIFRKANENHNFDSIKRISFDFQKDDNKLNKLYTLLFGKILEQRTEYYISEKKLI
ncbi:MAG: GNAT family N-acetyltransferase [Dysgonamonadaceae bacterium]|jgi:hypothetical protein|nr:GNAT family N-acetyltransferase [Dysgonamonadaceae bacterium]